MASLSALGYVGGAAPREQGADKTASPAAVAPKPPVGAASSFSSLKLIRTATLEVEVQNFTAAVDEATRTVTTLGGYVSERQSSDDGQGHERGQITLRIPSARFEGAVSAFRNLGRVRSEGVQTADVTKAYADLETRLQVKREAAARLREILIRQTGKVSEVLAVEREIARVVEEIEQSEGERRFFDSRVSLSTIILSLFEPAAMVTPGALDPIWAALRQSVVLMSGSVAGIIELVALALPFLVVIYLLFRMFRFWRRPRG